MQSSDSREKRLPSGPRGNPKQRASFASQCLGKKNYTMQEARRMAKMAKLRHQVLQPYHCPYCKGWHVGNVPGR